MNKTPIFFIVFPGRPVVKKNTKKVYRKHGRVMIVYSQRFKEWESRALDQIAKEWVGKETIDVPLEARFVFCFENHQGEADVSNLCEAPQDVLEKAKVIRNDKLIQIVNARKEFGVEPKTMVELYEIK